LKGDEERLATFKNINAIKENGIIKGIQDAKTRRLKLKNGSGSANCSDPTKRFPAKLTIEERIQKNDQQQSGKAAY
jgi:hypothetical protein